MSSSGARTYFTTVDEVLKKQGSFGISINLFKPQTINS